MKAVTVHLDEAVYRDFQDVARREGRTASDLIREAMADYRRRVIGSGQPSLAEAPPPASVGRVLEPWSGREDLVGDYLDRR
jgi:hypothetical protein